MLKQKLLGLLLLMISIGSVFIDYDITFCVFGMFLSLPCIFSKNKIID